MAELTEQERQMVSARCNALKKLIKNSFLIFAKMRLEKVTYSCYNINMKTFQAEYTNEALKQIEELEYNNKKKIFKAINLFEYLGKNAKIVEI